MAALVIAVMLLTAGGAALGGTGIEALFLDHYDPVLLPRILPFMYIGLGLTTMLTSFGLTSILGRIRRETLYSAMPVLIALVLVGARVALISHAEWIYPALWLGKEVANTLMGLVIWGLAGMGLAGLTGGRLRLPGRRHVEPLPSLDEYFDGRIPADEIKRIRDRSIADGSSMHDAFMDRLGWPAIAHDGRLLVTHQDALLLGGKVQAPAMAVQQLSWRLA